MATLTDLDVQTDAMFAQLAVLEADVERLQRHYASRTNTTENSGDHMPETTALAKAEGAAAALRKNDPGLTKGQALAKAMHDAGPELQAQYIEEARRGTTSVPETPAPPAPPKPVALAKAEEIATGLQRRDTSLSNAQAVSKAFEQNPDLAVAYRDEVLAGAPSAA
jgi:hypothetical protein